MSPGSADKEQKREPDESLRPASGLWNLFLLIWFR
jgi:hypothetical protein